MISLESSHFSKLPEEFYSKVEPTSFEKPQLVAVSNAALKTLGLKKADVTAEIFGGKKTGSAENIASVYAGHQFGSFVPQLGDGRAIMLGEVNGYELQLKGSGKTPYSRFGDGRAVLRSCIREFLCSESMHALGIPTTRALCVVGSNEPVQRETIESAAMVTRFARSHIRFGHFEFFHYRGEKERVKELVDFTISNYFEGASIDEFYDEVVTRTAKLIAHWQAVGFCHGVMNTDNMSILGLTIDYGPFGFLGKYDARHICNHSDQTGRYAYDQQPGIGLWNLQALAEALSTILPYEQAIRSLQNYQSVLIAEYAKLMRAKLGLLEAHDEDLYLVSGLLNLMQEQGTDYTNFFRNLCNAQVPDGFKEWKNKYDERLKAEPNPKRESQMKAVNPKYILRNHLAQNAIEKAEKGDFTETAKLLKILEKSYEDQTVDNDYSSPLPDGEEELCVSCSS